MAHPILSTSYPLAQNLPIKPLVMLAKILSAAIIGINAKVIAVEVDSSGGFPGYTTVGLADNAVKESKERVKSALKNSGFNIPQGKKTVSLSPASIKKCGAAFDLPIAIGLLVASNQISSDKIKDFIILGELALDGSLNRINGAIIFALCAKEFGYKGIILPSQNANEAKIVSDIEIVGAKSLSHAIQFLIDDENFSLEESKPATTLNNRTAIDLANS